MSTEPHSSTWTPNPLLCDEGWDLDLGLPALPDPPFSENTLDVVCDSDSLDLVSALSQPSVADSLGFESGFPQTCGSDSLGLVNDLPHFGSSIFGSTVKQGTGLVGSGLSVELYPVKVGELSVPIQLGKWSFCWNSESLLSRHLAALGAPPLSVILGPDSLREGSELEFVRKIIHSLADKYLRTPPEESVLLIQVQAVFSRTGIRGGDYSLSLNSRVENRPWVFAKLDPPEQGVSNIAVERVPDKSEKKFTYYNLSGDDSKFYQVLQKE